ncbi:hypothetical protein AD998_21920 [bacterium 336/3]|nr:hypothetical protein AD998_21920 [bacterium 336/3]
MEQPNRQYTNSEAYRYGFNGKENDREWGTAGLTQDYGFRLYNPAIAKFLSVDPLAPEYPWYTPYQFAGNMPIKYIDLDGLEPAMSPLDMQAAGYYKPSNDAGNDGTHYVYSEIQSGVNKGKLAYWWGNFETNEWVFTEDDIANDKSDYTYVEEPKGFWGCLFEGDLMRANWAADHALDGLALSGNISIDGKGGDDNASKSLTVVFGRHDGEWVFGLFGDVTKSTSLDPATGSLGVSAGGGLVVFTEVGEQEQDILSNMEGETKVVSGSFKNLSGTFGVSKNKFDQVTYKSYTVNATLKRPNFSKGLQEIVPIDGSVGVSTSTRIRTRGEALNFLKSMW